MLLAGHPSQQGQTLITEEYLKKLGNELVHLCNLIERHGLVDYECGVWEERILDGMSLPLPFNMILAILTCYYSPLRMLRYLRV